MRKIIGLLLIVLVISPAYAQEAEPGAEGIGDPFFDELGNGGYDALHYTLDLAVDMDTNMLDGTVTIEAQATQNLSAFNLDFNGFKIRELTVNDESAEYTRNGRELTIEPAEMLPEGEAFTVAVSYRGEPDVTGDRNAFSNGWIRYEKGVFVASEPAGAANWYPVNDHPQDKATYTFRITVAEPYVVAANGLLQETIDNGDTITYVWELSSPMSSYLATVNIGDLAERTDEGPNGLPIRNYFPAEVADKAAEVFAPTAEMIEFFSEIFGPYPFEAYGVVMADEPLFFALETQTLSLFGNEILQPGAWGGAGGPEGVISHELAHQWWGDSVSPMYWRDIWLNEGFATYSQMLWLEHTDGRAVMDGVMENLYAAFAEPRLGASDLPPAPGNITKDDMFNSASVYLRGAWTLHALRFEVGDEAFFEILRTYYDRFKYSNATTTDFIAAAEEVSGQDLSSFFEGWLYTDDPPPMPGTSTDA